MNWAHVFLAGYAGAVIAAAVGLLRKKNWIGRGGAVVLTLAAIALWNMVDIYYLRNADVQTREQKIDAAMQNLPTYKVIEEQEPQVFANIRTQVLAMSKKGKSAQQIIDFIQPQITAIQTQRLQSAPDNLVVAVMQIMMEQTAAIQKVSDDACYRFLFPEVKGGINPARMLSNEIIMKRIHTDVAMMRAAYGTNKHTVTNEERQNALKDIRSVIQKLVIKYGEDIAIMDDPRKGLGKEKIACELLQDLWNSAMLLPEKQAAGIIRMMLATDN